jgi:hypothetical protein
MLTTARDMIISSDIRERLTEILQKMEGRYCDPWMNTNQVSLYCGLSPRTIARGIADGDLRCSKKHGKNLFRRRDVDAWILGSKITRHNPDSE